MYLFKDGMFNQPNVLRLNGAIVRHQWNEIEICNLINIGSIILFSGRVKPRENARKRGKVIKKMSVEDVQSSI